MMTLSPCILVALLGFLCMASAMDFQVLHLLHLRERFLVGQMMCWLWGD
jgi:hypothetical protein